MKSINKYITGVAAAVSLALSAPASAVIVAGINFGPLGATLNLETATIASSFANGIGDASTSYGQITTVNGDGSYCADGSTNCSLYFIVNQAVNAGSAAAGQVFFGGTQVTIFFSGASAINLLGQSSATNLTTISGFTKWATLSGENGINGTAAGLAADSTAFVSINGGTVSVTGSGLLSVNKGDGLGIASVEDFLDANSIATFTGAFADIALTDSGSNFVLNPNDPTTSCSTATPTTGEFCIQGTADIRGRTVIPEPGTLALIGLGLLSVGFARRYSKK